MRKATTWEEGKSCPFWGVRDGLWGFWFSLFFFSCWLESFRGVTIPQIFFCPASRQTESPHLPATKNVFSENPGFGSGKSISWGWVWILNLHGAGKLLATFRGEINKNCMQLGGKQVQRGSLRVSGPDQIHRRSKLEHEAIPPVPQPLFRLSPLLLFFFYAFGRSHRTIKRLPPYSTCHPVSRLRELKNVGILREKKKKHCAQIRDSTSCLGSAPAIGTRVFHANISSCSVEMHSF